MVSHPDKIQLGPNQTIEEVEGKFVELTKAYKSLTDEAIRENLAKYGNPDGPQQREDKIAIPQWVVEGKNSIWVLGAYGLVLGVGIPVVVVSPRPSLRAMANVRDAGGSDNNVRRETTSSIPLPNTFSTISAKTPISSTSSPSSLARSSSRRFSGWLPRPRGKASLARRSGKRRRGGWRSWRCCWMSGERRWVWGRVSRCGRRIGWPWVVRPRDGRGY